MYVGVDQQTEALLVLASSRYPCMTAYFLLKPWYDQCLDEKILFCFIAVR